MERKQRQQTRVLFFAWGDSIHARRRIGIFCEDASFIVGVVSTFPYEFKDAQNFFLAGVLQANAKGSKFRRILIRGLYAVPGVLLYIVMRLFGGASLSECSNFIRDIFLVRRYIREFKPDLVFLQTLMYPCYLSYFWLHKIPMVVTFWNGDITWWARWTGIEQAFKKKIVQHGARRANAITVNSRAALQACLDYGVAEDMVRLIRYPGVNLQLFKPSLDKLDAREKTGLHGDDPIVFCPRGVGGYLNSDVIIESVVHVVRYFPSIRFLFLVRDEAKVEWDAHCTRAEELGVVSNVVVLGNVPWEDMPLYYQAADVMVSISSNDSLPNCMLEAMACGVPVIMGDIPQLSEWVTDSENGYSVPPRDPIALAERIIRVIADRDGVVEGFVQKNLDLIRRNVDSRCAAEAVKKLVNEVARDPKPE
jgi:glycosyltransferase involved in cell wall biosynthesis